MWFKREQKNRRLSRGHVLDVKVRSDQARATRMRLATGVFAVCFGTLFGLYLFWRAGEWTLNKFVYENSEFAVQQIDVESSGTISDEQLRRWSGVRMGQNLIALDLAAVKRNLEMASAINTASVERILPHTLRIRVTERTPVAQVNVPRNGGQNGISISVFQLDANGVVMQPLDPRQSVVPLGQMGESLPVVSGLNVFQLQSGHRLVTPEILAALKMIAAFPHSPMAGLADIQRVDVSFPRVFTVTTIQGGEITFGLDHLDEQLARWREIYDLGQRMNKAIASLDLAVANNVPVRWTERISAPSPAPKTLDTQNSWRKNV
ncbi:MAG TPA: FtsQ-type POTRA domain-containing protein [Verrucomicrobiae bacterium]|jgi:cell division protein FtsQ|nr:FtsQ-type POTRA domain-containing protein [Verrucomicrobiae bacterium]